MGFIGTKIYEHIKATEIAIEKGEKAQNTIKETFDTYNSKISTVTDLGKQFASDTESIKTTSDAVEALTQKYVELRKGVNADNSNKSLSSNEYQQYLDISNQLADSFPSLVAGSDSAGNAILNLGTNASDAADKLERLLQTQMAIAHTEIAKESADTFKGAFAEAKDIDDEISYVEKKQEELKAAKETITLSRDAIREALQSGRFDFKNISKNEGEQFEEVLKKYRKQVSDVEILSADGTRYTNARYVFHPIIDETELDAAVDDIANQLENMTSIDGLLGETEVQLIALEARQKEAWSTFAEGTVRPYLETASQLSDIPAELTNAIENNLQNIDWSSLYSTYDGSAEKMLLNEFVVPLQNLEKPAQEALTKALTLDPSELSLNEYVKQVNDALKSVSDDVDVQNEWREKFGFDQLIADAEKQADALSDVFTDKISEINSLSGEDRELAYQIVIEDEEFDGTWSDVMNRIQELKDSAAQGVTFNLSNFIIEASDAISLVDTLNAAMANSVSGKGLSVTYDVDEETGVATLTGDIANLINAYQDLDGYDPEILFERTANGVHINREALRALQAQEEAINKSKWLEQRKTLTDNLAKATENLAQAQSLGDDNAIASAQANIDSLQNQINTIDLLSAAYDGATSAYQKWLDAQSNGEEGDMYRTVSETMNERGQELYESGRYNTEEFRAIAQFYSDQDLSTASMEQVVRAYEAASEARERYFTGDKQGIDNFMYDMQNDAELMSKGIVKALDDGSIEFQAGADDVLAEWSGLSKEAVQTIMRAATEYTDTIKVGDTSGIDNISQKLAEATQKADEAKARLKELQDAGKISTDIELDVDVSSLDESGIEDRISELTDLKNHMIEINADPSEIEYVNQLLEEAELRKSQLESESKVDVMININGEEDVEALGSKLASLPSDSVTNISVNIQNENQLDNTVQQIEKVPKDTVANFTFNVSNQDQADALSSKIAELNQERGDNQITYTMNVIDNTGNSLQKDTSDATKTVIVNEVEGTKVEIKDETKTVTVNEVAGITVPVSDKSANVTYNKDSSSVDSYQPVDKSATVIFEKDSSIPDNYQPSDKNAKVNYTLGVTPTYNPPNITRTLTYNVETKGTVGFNGTAHPSGGSKFGVTHISGTAHASGTLGDTSWLKDDWKTKKDNVALIGEVAPELMVNPKTNTWETIGDNGAEFRHIPSGAIIFNGKQTKELLSKGFTKSRGRSMLHGTAYSSGSWVFGNTGGGNLGGTGYSPSYSSSNSTPITTDTSKSIDDATDSAEEFSEELDEIEIKIDRIERAIKNIEITAESAFETYATRNNALKEQISAVNEEISIQQQGYERYIQQANSVGLDEEYAAKIRDGLIDIETITDETLSENIKKYQEW